MTTTGWVEAVINSLAAALLLNAGLHKVVVPGRLREALRELLGRRSNFVSHSLVRTLAGLEVVSAIALTIAPVRMYGAVAAGVLGLVFAAAGLAGRLRRSTVSCGCLGGSGGRALGMFNVVVGLALAGVAVLNTGIASSQVDDGYAGAVTLWAAFFALMFCGWANRRLIHDVFRAPVQVGSEMAK
jgi:Methylamine utilisation protein MauE